MKKKILIFTGSRADYDLLKPLISRIKKDKRYKFLIAAGSHHFSKNLGFTSVWINAGYENFSDDIVNSKNSLDYETKDLSSFLNEINMGKI